MKRKWVEYNERLDDLLTNTNKIESLFGKEKDLLAILLDDQYLKRQESMEDTRTPVTSQQEDYSSEQNCEEEIWFGSIGENKINCDLCQECSYKCYQCRDETQPTVMFNFEPTEFGSRADEYESFSDEEIDSHWLLSSSCENELGSPITVMEKSCVFNYHEQPEEHVYTAFESGFL